MCGARIRAAGKFNFPRRRQKKHTLLAKLAANNIISQSEKEACVDGVRGALIKKCIHTLSAAIRRRRIALLISLQYHTLPRDDTHLPLSAERGFLLKYYNASVAPGKCLAAAFFK